MSNPYQYKPKRSSALRQPAVSRENLLPTAMPRDSTATDATLELLTRDPSFNLSSPDDDQHAATFHGPSKEQRMPSVGDIFLEVQREKEQRMAENGSQMKMTRSVSMEGDIRTSQSNLAVLTAHHQHVRSTEDIRAKEVPFAPLPKKFKQSHGSLAHFGIKKPHSGHSYVDSTASFAEPHSAESQSAYDLGPPRKSYREPQTTKDKVWLYRVYLWEWAEQPLCDWRVLYQLLVVITVLLSAVVAVAATAYEQDSHGVFIVEIILQSIISFDYLIRLVSHGTQPQFLGVVGSINFFFHPRYLIDLISCVPSPFLVYAGDFREDTEARILFYFSIFRLLKLDRYIGAGGTMWQAIQTTSKELIAAYFLCIVGIINISAIMYVVEGDDQSEFSSVLESMWWGFITYTTIGYGDVSPVTDAGKAVVTVSVLVLVASTALPSAIIGTSFALQASENKRKRWREFVLKDRAAMLIQAWWRNKVINSGKEFGISQQPTWEWLQHSLSRPAVTRDVNEIAVTHMTWGVAIKQFFHERFGSSNKSTIKSLAESRQFLAAVNDDTKMRRRQRAQMRSMASLALKLCTRRFLSARRRYGRDVDDILLATNRLHVHLQGSMEYHFDEVIDRLNRNQTIKSERDMALARDLEYLQTEVVRLNKELNASRQDNTQLLLNIAEHLGIAKPEDHEERNSSTLVERYQPRSALQAQIHRDSNGDRNLDVSPF
eukprot:Clim_evm1s66 gene=Clim_evmTU1s66